MNITNSYTRKAKALRRIFQYWKRTETTNFGSSETMRIAADVEDVRLLVHSITKERFGLKLQE